MANISKLQLIQYKRRKLASMIAEQREALAALEAQEHDLEVAERVLVSLDEDTERIASRDRVVNSEESTATESTGKPEGIPTMPQMIYEALRDAKARGQKGLEPKDITAFIAAKWWPDVKINNVGPIAWRLYKSEKLAKRQSRYRLPDEVATFAAA